VGLGDAPLETEADLEMDPDDPKRSAKPGELTNMFYVPEELVDASTEVDLPETEVPEVSADLETELEVDQDDAEPLVENTTGVCDVEPEAPVSTGFSEVSAEDMQQPPVNGTDLRVGDLDDWLDELEDVQLDTTEIDYDLDLEFNISSMSGAETAFDQGLAEKETEANAPDISRTSASDETSDPAVSELQAEPFAEVDPALSFSEESDAHIETGEIIGEEMRKERTGKHSNGVSNPLDQERVEKSEP
jgi:hypothetical protein